MSHPKYKLGCIRSIVHSSEELVSLPKPSIFPPKISLRDKMPPVYDQGQLGSCTSNAAAGAYEYELMKQGLTDWRPSRLMLYWLERQRENTINSDSGAQMADGILALTQTGICDEKTWPYDISKFTVRPDLEAYAQAKKPHHHALAWRRLAKTVQDIKTSLVNKNPVLIGFSVYESFYDIGHSGMMPLPQPNEALEGGHETLIIGYDDATRTLEVRNSWSADWGDQGHFWMPYSYAIDPQDSYDLLNISKIA